MKPRSSTSNSDTNIKYLKKYLLFFLLLLFICIIAGAVVNSVADKYDARNPTQRITQYQLEDFYALPENSLDMLILGSSHAMCTYDPFLIEHAHGLSVYNLGTALQQPDTGYYLLKEVLKTQKPKYLVFDLYFKVFQNDKSAEQALTVLKEMRTSVNKLEFLLFNLSFGTRAEYFSGWLNPFGRLYTILADVENKNEVPERSEFYKGRGFYVSNAVVAPEALTLEKHPFPKAFEEFTARQVEYLKKITRLAQENNIEVLFVTAPIPPTIQSHIAYYNEITEAVEHLANSLNINYTDFNIDQKTGSLKLSDLNYADQGHLNENGAKIFGEYFNSFLSTILSEK